MVCPFALGTEAYVTLNSYIPLMVACYLPKNSYLVLETHTGQRTATAIDSAFKFGQLFPLICITVQWWKTHCREKQSGQLLISRRFQTALSLPDRCQQNPTSEPCCNCAQELLNHSALTCSSLVKIPYKACSIINPFFSEVKT